MTRACRALGAAALLSILATGCATTGDPDGLVSAPTPRTASPVAELQTQLGIGYLSEGQLELAWKRLHRAIEADPNYSTAHNAMGLLYDRLNEIDKAEHHLRRAVQLNPTDAAAQVNYGAFLCRQGRYEEGEERMLRALKNSLYPSPEVAYANAGLCLKNAGDAEKAESYFRSSLQIEPRMAVALYQMAELSFDRGNHLSARGYLQRYLEVAQHSPRTLWLGIRVERELGDRDAAASYAMLLRGRYPDARETQLLHQSGLR
jgi:type IV pilus assembly protein PilF